MTDDHNHYLARHEITLLSERLRELRDWVCQDLDDTISRQVAFGDKQDGKRTETPVVFNENAAEVAANLHGTLRAWVEHTCTHSTRAWPGEQRSAHYARWLDRHLIDLAKTEEAPTAVDELTDAWKQAKRAIDRPQDQEFAGPCQSTTPGVECGGVYCRKNADLKNCQTCGATIDIPALRATMESVMRDWLYTKQELRTALVIYLKKPVPRSTIDGWIRNGRLADHAGKYRLDEALTLAATRHTARTA
ncbi:helix-turn-helix DNA-binding domain protein [Gordonia phage PhorbesPhlower]|nr:helix-turn-helix DNA-binding domain protein [Gordonia phage PhorbesPhlower]UUG69932.1 helix-turn-helix DNA binding protein [Gordonia phage Morkie]